MCIAAWEKAPPPPGPPSSPPLLLSDSSSFATNLERSSSSPPPKPRRSHASIAAARASALLATPLGRAMLGRALKVGVSTDQGGVGHMEDECVVHAPPAGDFAFCAVFDGHGGGYASQYCREHLHFNVMASPAFSAGNTPQALLDGFRKTEAGLLAEQSNGDGGGGGGGARGSCCGSTALVLVLQPEVLHLAWLGDCRAVLSRGGRAVALTADHHLSDPSERARVIAEGGRVEGNRLGGFLEVARALGDFDAAAGRKPAGLSASPELHSEPIGEADEFVVLGSDGLWGVVEPDDAVRLARAELAAYTDAAMASEKLVEVALKRRADDNITAVVVCLKAPTADAETPRRPRLALKKPTPKSPPRSPPARSPAGPKPLSWSPNSGGSASGGAAPFLTPPPHPLDG